MKSNSTTIILSLSIILLFSSCSTTKYYGIANGGGESTYLTKPVYNDTNVISHNISGKVYHSLDKISYNSDEKMFLGEVNIHRSHTHKFFNYSYAFLGYAGKYEVKDIQGYAGNKFLYGTGLLGEFNANFPFKMIEWRPLGIRTSILYENGNYATFRKNAATDGLIVNIHPNNMAVNVGLSSEIILKLKKVNLGLYATSGFTFGKDGNNFLTGTNCIHVSYKKFTWFVQRNIGVFGYGINYSTGLNYRFR